MGVMCKLGLCLKYAWMMYYYLQLINRKKNNF